jgi:hypothetical protein
MQAMLATGCRHPKPKVEPSPIELAAKNAGLTLPQAPNAGEEDRPQVIVVGTRDRVSLAGDRFPIANVPADGQLGLSAADKLDGFRDEYFVTPLAHAIVGAPRPVLAADGGDAPERPVEEGISRSPSVVVVADAKTQWETSEDGLERLAKTVADEGASLEVRRDAGLALARLERNGRRVGLPMATWRPRSRPSRADRLSS